ncbi:hypothetical protein D3C73_1047680 [compost metagenome]
MFRDGGNVRRQRRTLRIRHAQRQQRAALGLGQARHDGVEVHGHLAREQGGDGFARALVGHVQDIDAGNGLQHLTRQVRGGARAKRRIGQLARIGARIGDHFRQRLERLLRVGQQDVRGVGHQGHQFESVRVIGQALLQEAVGDDGGRAAHQQRVAIGRRARHRRAADGRRGARSSFHDKGLTQFGGQRGAQLARDQVRGGAGLERHDDAHGVLRPISGRGGCRGGLCAGLRRESGGGQAGQRPDETKFHGFPLIAC